MLALTRRLNQAIVIQVGDDLITIVITKFDRRGEVVLGIEAPAHIRIDREEIYLKIKAQEEIENDD